MAAVSSRTPKVKSNASQPALSRLRDLPMTALSWRDVVAAVAKGITAAADEINHGPSWTVPPRLRTKGHPQPW